MRQVSRSFNNVYRLAILALLAFSLGGSNASAQEARNGEKEMIAAEEYAAQEELLKEKLTDDTLWTDARRKGELLGYLEMASALRADLTAPLLAGRIGYDPYPEKIDSSPRRAPEMIYPAYKTLKSIGLPAIPHMLAELKKTNPQSDKHVLLITCMWEIYDQGGHGLVLAKKRLELELAATKDEKEKVNLQAALDHPIFHIHPIFRQEDKTEEHSRGDEGRDAHRDNRDTDGKREDNAGHERRGDEDNPGKGHDNSPPPGRDDGDSNPQRPRGEEDNPEKGHDNSPPPGRDNKGE